MLRLFLFVFWDHWYQRHLPVTCCRGILPVRLRKFRFSVLLQVHPPPGCRCKAWRGSNLGNMTPLSTVSDLFLHTKDTWGGASSAQHWYFNVYRLSLEIKKVPKQHRHWNDMTLIKTVCYRHISYIQLLYVRITKDSTRWFWIFSCRAVRTEVRRLCKWSRRSQAAGERERYEAKPQMWRNHEKTMSSYGSMGCEMIHLIHRIGWLHDLRGDLNAA